MRIKYFIILLCLNHFAVCFIWSSGQGKISIFPDWLKSLRDFSQFNGVDEERCISLGSPGINNHGKCSFSEIYIINNKIRLEKDVSLMSLQRNFWVWSFMLEFTLRHIKKFIFYFSLCFFLTQSFLFRLYSVLNSQTFQLCVSQLYNKEK